MNDDLYDVMYFDQHLVLKKAYMNKWLIVAQVWLLVLRKVLFLDLTYIFALSI